MATTTPMTRHAVLTRQRDPVIDVTDVVARAVAAAGVADGMAVMINEDADPDVKHDPLAELAALVPHREAYYRHGEMWATVTRTGSTVRG